MSPVITIPRSTCSFEKSVILSAVSLSILLFKIADPISFPFELVLVNIDKTSSGSIPSIVARPGAISCIVKLFFAVVSLSEFKSKSTLKTFALMASSFPFVSRILPLLAAIRTSLVHCKIALSL